MRGCRSSVANVPTHQVAESAATSPAVQARSLHHAVARGLLVVENVDFAIKH